MKVSISQIRKAVSKGTRRSILEWCFPFLEVKAVNDSIHKDRSWEPNKINRKTDWWEEKLASQEEAVEVVRDLYQSEIAAIARLEDKIQGHISVIMVLFPVLITATGALVNGLVGSPRCPAAWIAVVVAIGALIELWSAYLLAGQGHGIRTRWQADASSIKEAFYEGKNVHIHVAAVEAVSTELNSGTIRILGNLLEGTRMTLTRVIVLISLGVAVYLIWMLGVPPQEIVSTPKT